MDIRQLRYFAAVVDQGTMTAAAEALHISQPPLSAQIKLLEDELQCTLFERTTRKMELTEAGRLLYRRAEGILDQCSSMQNEIKDFLSGGIGTLKIGVVSSAVNSFCLSSLKTFRKTHPGVKFELHEGNTFRMLEAVRNGEVELAFVRRPFSAGDLMLKELRDDSLCAVGSKKLLKKEGRISVRKLSEFPLLIYRRWEDTVREAFREADVPMQIVCTADDARTVAAMAEAGMGVGIVPKSVISVKSPLMEREIKDPEFSSRLCVVSRKDTYRSSAARQFLESMV